MGLGGPSTTRAAEDAQGAVSTPTSVAATCQLLGQSFSDGIMPFSFFAISYVLECLPSGQRKIKISMKFTVLLPHETASEREINSV